MISSLGGLDFVLVLHTHVPHVMRHGRWPHGSDWLMDAAIDSYLPMIDVLSRLESERIDSPVTINVTPIVAAQLRDPRFAPELRRFFAQRNDACDADEQDLAASGDTELADVVRHWRAWFAARGAQFEQLDGDIIGALGRLERAGRLELMSSAATHGFLPLLARDESIRLQLFVGRAQHEQFFGRAPAGCWLPECAYRPRGMWAPLPDVKPRMRKGIEAHLEDAGYRFTVVDAHLARAGQPLDAYRQAGNSRERQADRSPYGNYAIGRGRSAVRALVRDPVATRQVWSRDGGYPGAAPYLEFHKMRFPGGLQLWSVTGSRVDLGEKRAYRPSDALHEAQFHARHFAHLLGDVGQSAHPVDGVLVAPFDAELFGHWWFEGPEFLAEVYRELRHIPLVHPTTASAHIDRTTATGLHLPAGSWGRDGDFSFWLNYATIGMWRRMWALEERFWNVAPDALSRSVGGSDVVLAQAARSLLLAQSSDWEFMISAAEVADYGEARFAMHAGDAETLVAALERRDGLESVGRLVDVLLERDAVFPDVLDSVARALGSHAVAAFA